jgi:5-dehydro-2-deoxygluconokinase
LSQPAHGIIETSTVPVQPIKPTGAGDSFLGAFIGQLYRSDDLLNALIYGSCSAAMVVTSVGCAPAMPTATELDDFVTKNLQRISQKIKTLAE